MHKRLFAAVAALFLVVAPAFCQLDDGEAEEYEEAMSNAMRPTGKPYHLQRREAWDSRVKPVSGKVYVRPEESEEWVSITSEVPVEDGDHIRTESDASAEIYLDDKGVIALGRASSILVSSVRQTGTEFNLISGSLVAKIQKFLDEKFSFKVRTPAAVCAVRGTEFAVEHSAMSKDTSVAVYDEGKVAVMALNEKGRNLEEFTIEKNTEITVNPGKRRFRPAPLSKMSRNKPQVNMMRTRLETLKRSWSPGSFIKRKEIRERVLRKKLHSRSVSGEAGEESGSRLPQKQQKTAPAKKRQPRRSGR